MTMAQMTCLIFYTGILAYLLDAYHENDYLDSKGIKTTHSKLRLHPTLAPVKVAVLSRNTLSTDLDRVARQLATELRQAGKAGFHTPVVLACWLGFQQL